MEGLQRKGLGMFWAEDKPSGTAPPPNPRSPGVRGGKVGFCPAQWFCATAFSLPRALFSPWAQYPCPHSHLQGKGCFSVLVIHSRAIPMSVSNPAFVQGWNFGNKKGDWDLDHRKSECLPTCWLVPPLTGFWPGTGFWKGAAVDLMASVEGLTLGNSHAHSVGS